MRLVIFDNVRFNSILQPIIWMLMLSFSTFSRWTKTNTKRRILNGATLNSLITRTCLILLRRFHSLKLCHCYSNFSGLICFYSVVDLLIIVLYWHFTMKLYKAGAYPYECHMERCLIPFYASAEAC